MASVGDFQQLVDELGSLFEQMPAEAYSGKIAGIPLGNVGKTIQHLWQQSFGMPEGAFGRLARDSMMALNHIFQEGSSLHARFVGSKSPLRKFINENPESDARIFRAVDEGPDSDAWKLLNQEETKWANEIRSTMRRLWETLAPVTTKARWLKSEIAITERQIDAYRGKLEASTIANILEHAPDLIEDVRRSGTDILSLGLTPEDSLAHLARLVSYRNSLRNSLDEHVKGGGIKNYIHHTIEKIEAERGLGLGAFVDPRSGDRWHATASQAKVGPMMRRTGAAKESGALKESVIASLSDYLPKAVSYYYRNATLAKWVDYLYGTESPLTYRDVVGSVRKQRHARVRAEGQDWGIHGTYILSKDGKLHERRVPEFDPDNPGKVKWISNPNAPAGKIVVVLTDWAGRRDPHKREQAPAPSIARIGAAIEENNRQLFIGQARRIGSLLKVARSLGDGKLRDGFDKMWSAWSKGIDSEDFQALPSRARKDMMRFMSYLPNARTRVLMLDPRHLEALATIRHGGFFERADVRRGDTLREYVDRFAGVAESLRLSFFHPETILSEVGRVANALKIGWYNPKTAVTVLTGGAFFTATLPIHPGLQMQAAVRAFEALFRWSRYGKTLESRGGMASDITPRNPVFEVREDVPDPFLGPTDILRTPKEVLDKLPPEKRQEREIWDDAIVAAVGNPTFHGKIADMALVLKADQGGEASKISSFAGDVVRGRRGYELIAAMEQYVRMQAFLATYVQARRAGKTADQAKVAAENMVIYAHGVFNQATASAFFRSSLGPFLGGIKSFASRAFGIWWRSPAWMKARYSGAAIALMAMTRALGLGDATNTVGTDVSYMWGVSPFLEELVEQYMEEAEGVPIAEQIGEYVLRPLALPLHFPTISESPGLAMSKAVLNAGQAAIAIAKGDKADAARLAGRAIQEFIPNALTPLQKAFLSRPSEFEPGSYDYRANLIANLFPAYVDDRVTYRLGNTGLMQLALDLAPFDQLGPIKQIEQRNAADARDRILTSRRVRLRREIEGLVRRSDDAHRRGVMTETERQAARDDFRALIQEARTLGIPVEDKKDRDRLISEARESLSLAKFGPVARTILSQRLLKTQKVEEFARAMEERLISRKEAQAVADHLRGTNSLGEWLRGPEISPEARKRFTIAFREFVR